MAPKGKTIKVPKTAIQILADKAPFGIDVSSGVRAGVNLPHATRVAGGKYVYLPTQVINDPTPEEYNALVKSGWAEEMVSSGRAGKGVTSLLEPKHEEVKDGE